MRGKGITFRIVLLIIIMAVLFAIPGFAETYDTLKEKFVTREEWNAWINGSGGATGISSALNNLEAAGQLRVQSKVQVEMDKRGIELPE